MKTNTLKFALLATLAVRLASAQLTTASCGGLGDRPCPSGSEDAYYANYDRLSSTLPMSCDYGLTGTTVCGYANRLQLPKTNTTEVGRAMLQQEYSIGADTPINWINIFGSHNSYSSYTEGATSSQVADQQYSITDQLQAGARYLRLDPHYYDGQMRLCHNETGMSSGMICPVYQSGRLYLFGIREIADWLKANPGELVILRLHHQVDSGQEYLLTTPIEAYLGSMVFRPSDLTTLTWPTLRQLRASGKQIVILGDNPSDWVFNWKTYVVNDAYTDLTTFSSCQNQDGLPVFLRAPTAFSYVGEDRSLSNSHGYLDPANIRFANSCGFGLINVDFLLALDKAPKASQTTPDLRREAFVWSFGSKEPSFAGPAKLAGNPFAYWYAANKTEVYPFACAGPQSGAPFPNPFFPAMYTWKISTGMGIWSAGETTCQREFGAAYHFWAPASAQENTALQMIHQIAGCPTTWLNYFMGPVLAATPNQLSFRWDKTQSAPAAQTMMFHAGLGGGLTYAPGPSSTESSFLIAKGLTANTASIGIDISAAGKLAPGTYTQTLQVRELDPATGQTNTTNLPITLTVTDTVKLGGEVAPTLSNCGGSTTASVIVQSGGAFKVKSDVSWLHMTADSTSSPATVTITADVTGLTTGVHYGQVVVYAPNSTNGTVTVQVTLKVAPQTTIVAAPTSLNLTADGKSFTGSQNFCWEAGSAHTVSAPATQMSGSYWGFASWSDGGAATHTYSQPAAAVALTAKYGQIPMP